MHALKFTVAFGLIFFIVPGTLVPGQYYCKLLTCEVARRAYLRKSKESFDDEHSGKLVRFLNWKLGYLKRNGMLSSELLSNDLHTLCRQVDEASQAEDATNFAINESLSFVLHSLMPVLESNHLLD
jgi:hypothetical protein